VVRANFKNPLVSKYIPGKAGLELVVEVAKDDDLRMKAQPKETEIPGITDSARFSLL
jgi:hypothetical protein